MARKNAKGDVQVMAEANIRLKNPADLSAGVAVRVAAKAIDERDGQPYFDGAWNIDVSRAVADGAITEQEYNTMFATMKKLFEWVPAPKTADEIL